MKHLFLFCACVFALGGCYKDDWEAVVADNHKLSAENYQLKSEIYKLQETAQFNLQKGQESLANGKYDAAVEYFLNVMNKYPGDPLVPHAKKSLAAAKQKHAAEVARQKREKELAAKAREKEMAESGEPVDYGKFYAKSSTGLRVGKRYRFQACLTNDTPCLRNSYGLTQYICSLNMEFDSRDDYERWLQTGREHCGTIVASMGWNGRVSVHRLR